MKAQLGMGLIIAVLLPLALFLFEVLKFAGAIAAILLLAGLWILVFGVTIGEKVDRLYSIGMGLIIAILSAFYFIPPRFVLGLVLVAIIAMVVLSLVVRPKKGTSTMQSRMPTSTAP